MEGLHCRASAIFRFRLGRCAVEEKKIIGSLASKLIRDGDHVFLDSGTTCSELVPYMKRMHEITILTNQCALGAGTQCVRRAVVSHRWPVPARPHGLDRPDGGEHAQPGPRLHGIYRRRRSEHRLWSVGQRFGEHTCIVRWWPTHSQPCCSSTTASSAAPRCSRSSNGRRFLPSSRIKSRTRSGSNSLATETLPCYFPTPIATATRTDTHA